MLFLTINDIRDHVRIDDPEQDELLVHYGKSAEQEALNYIGMTFDELLDEYGEVPAPIKHACLMRVGSWYKHREDISDRQYYTAPFAWEVLLMPYCKDV